MSDSTDTHVDAGHWIEIATLALSVVHVATAPKGPGGVPVVGYAVALWLTLRLLK